MGYEDQLQEKVSEHPMDEFAAMGDLSDMDNFGKQFAELLNALSTNVIIPTEDEDELKEWAAEHAQGERVYAEVDGDLQIAEVPNDASGPGDVGVRGVSGIDMDHLERGEALVKGENGEVEGITPAIGETTQEFNPGDVDQVDVSSYFQEIEFALSSADGEDGEEGTSSGSSIDGGDGGIRCIIQGTIDVSDYETLEVHVASGQSGYNDGQSGSTDVNDSGARRDPGHGGDGGGSSAIIGIKGNGNREILVEAGGGGGGSGGASDDRPGGDGGDGGGPGGSGGEGEGGTQNDGSSGSYTSNQAVTIISSGDTHLTTNPLGRIFSSL